MTGREDIDALRAALRTSERTTQTALALVDRLVRERDEALAEAARLRDEQETRGRVQCVTCGRLVRLASSPDGTRWYCTDCPAPAFESERPSTEPLEPGHLRDVLARAGENYRKRHGGK